MYGSFTISVHDAVAGAYSSLPANVAVIVYVPHSLIVVFPFSLMVNLSVGGGN